ncbi:MAG: sortase [Actinobacteria bacterium]|nr:sortase [Actinomycetota bacterium]
MTTTLEAPPDRSEVAPAPATRPKFPPKPPKPPRRLPRSMLPLAPLTRTQMLIQSASAILAALLIGFLVNLLVISHLQHAVSQQQQRNVFREQLAAGTAPVSEGTFDDILLVDGAPVALLDIPSLGLHEVVGEGTSSGDLMLGPGHRRDTVLPGQAGVSVIMGRAGAYGGPFSRLQELAPGERFSVVTGQGKQLFEVIGVRYAGDPAPPAPKAGESRLILETARGPAYLPTGVARVDAELVGESQDAGARRTTFDTLPPQDKSLATDTRTAWALVFALQFFLLAEAGAVWTYRRIGAQKMWVVFVPILLLAGLIVGDQLNRFLPNLL